MPWWGWILIGIVGVIVLAVYSCCVMAGKADEAMEKMREEERNDIYS